jgi:hypothetical protein
MNRKLTFIIMLLFVSLILSTNAFSQYQNKPDEELTKEEATLKIQDWQTKVNALDDQLKAINANIDDLKKQLDQTNKDIKDCNESFYTLLGITPADVENFRQRLGVIEGRIRDMKKLSDDVLADKQDDVKALEKDLNALRKEKTSLLPEFFNRIVADARDIKGLYREKLIKSYTVGTWAKDKDCLWNIAGKIDIYGDPFLWPKIWQYNTTIIRNPDIIHPGEVLQLPPAAPKTPDEIKAERKYWRHKREAMEAEQGAPTSKADEPKKVK